MAVVDSNDLCAKIAMLVPTMTAKGISIEFSSNVFWSISVLIIVTPYYLFNNYIITNIIYKHIQIVL